MANAHATKIEEALRGVSQSAFELIDASLAAVVARRALDRAIAVQRGCDDEMAAELERLDTLGRYAKSLEGPAILARREAATAAVEAASRIVDVCDKVMREEADALALEIEL